LCRRKSDEACLCCCWLSSFWPYGWGAQSLAPSADLTSVRGFNYTPSRDETIGSGGHAALWLKYDGAQVERDLTNARRLNLNQVRVFVAYSAWKVDPELFNRKLR
jgi:hypothetical protein